MFPIVLKVLRGLNQTTGKSGITVSLSNAKTEYACTRTANKPAYLCVPIPGVNGSRSGACRRRGFQSFEFVHRASERPEVAPSVAATRQWIAQMGLSAGGLREVVEPRVMPAN